MTHDRVIALLLGTAPGSTAEDRRAAEEHVARCSDCWDVVRLQHELVTGEPPPESERMAALYGCADVRDELYLLAGLPAAAIRGKYPHAAAHLGWCHACRDRLAELLQVEAAAAGGELGGVLVGAPVWREVRAVGEILHELVGRIVVRVREATVAFTAVPAGVLLAPAPPTADAFRGEATSEVGRARELRLPLGDTGLTAEVRLEPEGGGRVGLTLRILGGPHGVLSVSLRDAGPDAGAGLARYTVRHGDAVALKGVRPGPYVLEVLEKERALRFQVAIDIELSE